MESSIDREKVIKGLEHCANEADCRGCVYQEQMKGRSDECDCTGEALALLKEQESVIEALKSDLDETLAVLGEYAEIVRCADCTFRNEINCPQYYRRNELPDDWFCADGERKDNG